MGLAKNDWNYFLHIFTNVRVWSSDGPQHNLEELQQRNLCGSRQHWGWPINTQKNNGQQPHQVFGGDVWKLRCQLHAVFRRSSTVQRWAYNNFCLSSIFLKCCGMLLGGRQKTGERDHSLSKFLADFRWNALDCDFHHFSPKIPKSARFSKS